MRFKVGDKVRIIEDLTLEDVEQIHDMLEFEGLEATVETVFEQSYHLTVDNHEWYWMDELLEPVEEEAKMEDKKYIKFEIPEWVNWLARESNGDLYGYRNKPNKGVATWCIGQVNVGQINCYLVSDDPNHYPQVKWSDEEPKQYQDGITINPHGALAAIQNYGRFADPVSVDGLYRTPDDAPTVEQEPDMIQNPPHYKQYSFEPIDIITEVVKEYPPEIGFHVGTVLKYLFRSPFKGKQLQDIEKAEYYLQRAIKELEEAQ